MSKEKLDTNKAALIELQITALDKLADYKAQIAVIDQKLSDLGKPEVTSEFLDKINETITEAVESIELDNGVTCDFEIDYDNRIAMSDVRFEDTHDVADKIYCAVEKLFAEISTENKLDETEVDNHPVENLQG